MIKHWHQSRWLLNKNINHVQTIVFIQQYLQDIIIFFPDDLPVYANFLFTIFASNFSNVYIIVIIFLKLYVDEPKKKTNTRNVNKVNFVIFRVTKQSFLEAKYISFWSMNKIYNQALFTIFALFNDKLNVSQLLINKIILYKLMFIYLLPNLFIFSF